MGTAIDWEGGGEDGEVGGAHRIGGRRTLEYDTPGREGRGGRETERKGRGTRGTGKVKGETGGRRGKRGGDAG